MINYIRSLNLEEFHRLKSSSIGNRIIILDEVGSTNDYAKKIAYSEAEGTIVLSNTQTKGKGRLGRSWEAGINTDIAMSIILKPDTDILTAQRLTLIGGLAVSKAIKEASGEPAYIKWPNDIVLNNKKICGILAETSIQANKLGYCILGIGINVNSNNFKGELEKKAGSLFSEMRRHFSREEIIIKVIEEMNTYYPKYIKDGFSPFIEEYESLCLNIGKEVRLVDGNTERTGFCEAVTNTGELVIKDKSGERYSVSAGEVSVRGLYGYL